MHRGKRTPKRQSEAPFPQMTDSMFPVHKGHRLPMGKEV